MRGRFLLIMLVATAALASAKTPPPAKVIDGYGTVTDPDNDCDVSLATDKLSFKVPGVAHDFAAELRRWNAPRVLSKVKGDFIVQVKVSGSFAPGESSTIDGRTPYKGAGLLLVADERNHLSLQRGSLFANGKVRHYANFELRADGKLSASRYGENVDADGDLFLRIERRGSKVYAEFSPDGIKWKSYAPIDVDFPRAVQVGVVAVSSSEEPFECAFQEFALYRKAKR